MRTTKHELASQSLYQIFPRNFSADGGLDAAAAELPRIAELGFDIVYLTPVHPIGRLARKGEYGSPYAIADYRAVDPDVGGEAALIRFFEAAHRLGLKVIMDVVFNHTSPDSVLVAEHPDWFIKGPDGRPGRKVDDWSDVVDLDFSVPALRQYLIETLELWLLKGADGFRCDVASLVPLDFWIEARARAEAIKPTVWLAESVHQGFVLAMREQGHYAACDPELHHAFDLTYDYDGRDCLEAYLHGEQSIQAYLDHLGIQAALYPAGAMKARFLENHDQPRIAGLVDDGLRLRTITALWMLLPGCFFAYMGQEGGLRHKPDLFSTDPIDRAAFDQDFLDFFRRAHLATKPLRRLSWRFRQLNLGLVLAETMDAAGRSIFGLFNLDGRRGRLDAGRYGLAGRSGRDLFSGTMVRVGAELELGGAPLLIFPDAELA